MTNIEKWTIDVFSDESVIYVNKGERGIDDYCHIPKDLIEQLQSEANHNGFTDGFAKGLAHVDVEIEEARADERKKYDLLYSKYERYSKFIESLEAYTEDYDDFCDCNKLENYPHHNKDCMTIAWRKDALKLEQPAESSTNETKERK